MIYLVDDQKNFLQLFKKQYKDRVKTFDHPNDAFINMGTDKPSLFITDVFMPLTPATEYMLARGMDGLQLMDLVKIALPNTKIIVVSGNKRSEIEKQFPGKLAQADYFFNKPLGDDFYDLVEKLEPKK